MVEGKKRKRSGKPSIRDVAEQAGVALGTVSRVLHGNSSVSPEVRERVLKVISELDYQPDQVAQSMRLGVTKTAAFAIRDVSIAGFGVVVAAAEEALRAKGYTLLLTMTNEEKARELELLNILQRRRVDGVVMTTSADNDGELEKAIRAAKFPIVLLDREVPQEFDAVMIDHRQGVAAATEYLLRLGHQRIALITGNPAMRPARERIEGYRQARALHPGLGDEIVLCGGFTAEYGFAAMEKLLSAEDRPTAVIAGGMNMLPGVVRSIKSHGLRIPEDISVVAGGESDLASMTEPGTTSIRWDGRDQGRIAIELLLSRLGNRSAPARRIKLPTELITRGSCAAPPKN